MAACVAAAALITSRLSFAAFKEDVNQIGQICLGDVEAKQSMKVGNSDTIVNMTNIQGSHMTIRTYSAQNLLTIDVSYMVLGDTLDPDTNFLKIKKINNLTMEDNCNNSLTMSHLEQGLESLFKEVCSEIRILPSAIKRGERIWRYGFTTDSRIMELDFDRLVYRGISDYQRIEIYHSPIDGNHIRLDDESNNSEYDNSYTEMTLCLEENIYKGKDILLLGGGVGHCFNALLKEQPNMVTMVEIDPLLIEVSKVYMRGGCGDSLDRMAGPNHKIIVGDGFQVLENAIKETIQFDYVIDDMCMVPSVPEPKSKDIRFQTGDVKTRNSSALDLSRQVLKPGGSYIQTMDPYPMKNHTDFQAMAERLGGVWTRRECPCVRTFHENYFTYQVTFPVKVAENGLII